MSASSHVTTPKDIRQAATALEGTDSNSAAGARQLGA